MANNALHRKVSPPFHFRKSDSTVAVREVLVTKRDEYIVSQIDRYLEDREGESETAAILFGAGHMPAIVSHLSEKYGYKSMKAEWISVISVT